ncbi:MAG: VWA domain-containing protein, partial [Myxococcota bacterium]
FVEERELTVTLLVDMSGSADFGTKGRTKRELLAQVGALLAFSAIKNNDRVGLVIFTDEVELYVPPRKGRSHVLRVIRELVEFQPRRTQTNIGEALNYLGRVQKRRSVCFLLSDFLDEGFENPLKLAMARHDVVALRVVDPAERALPDLGLVELVDAETGAVEIVDTSDARIRKAYADARAKSEHEAQRRLRQLGCDAVELSTDGDFVTPLVGFFRVRSARLRGGR